MSRIVFPFKNSRDAEVAKAANRIISNVKGNSFFPDTSLVQELEKRTSKFQVSMNNAADGSRTLIAVRKEDRRSLIDIMVQLGFYVMQVSNGDRVKMLSSGFDLAKENGGARLLATIQSMVVTNGNPGEANILVNSVKGARAYVHQYSADPPSETTVWVSETTAHRKHTITGLKPLVTYWFRVIAIGLNGQSVISEVISRVIL
ncbi:fibronectin type III domain-containing protein [Niastella sp. OAS944]|uniref:fibronectin type III domain-containing protein n=1 Tax=Niastella sp. OAS944 TaxID=2664089 RepID=UPI0034753A81|nr:hypothetical protein [Chitinophagaceae bacterium OAS944]